MHSDVVRIGSIIIFHLSKLWKAKFFILCDVIFLVRLQGKFEIDHSGVKGLNHIILCQFGGLRTLIASRHNRGSLQKALDLLCGEVRDTDSFAKSFVCKILHCLRRKRKPIHVTSMFAINISGGFRHEAILTFHVFCIASGLYSTSPSTKRFAKAVSFLTAIGTWICT